MQVTSTAKYIRISPRKLRLVAELIKGLSAQQAVEELEFVGKRAARSLIAAIKTAMADAVNNFKCSKEALVVKTIDIGEGPIFKRWRPVARGQAHPYLKRTSHIKVVLEEKSSQKPASPADRSKVKS